MGWKQTPELTWVAHMQDRNRTIAPESVQPVRRLERVGGHSQSSAYTCVEGTASIGRTRCKHSPPHKGASAVKCQCCLCRTAGMCQRCSLPVGSTRQIISSSDIRLLPKPAQSAQITRLRGAIAPAPRSGGWSGTRATPRHDTYAAAGAAPKHSVHTTTFWLRRGA